MGDQTNDNDNPSEVKKQKVEYWHCKYRMVVLAGIRL